MGQRPVKGVLASSAARTAGIILMLVCCGAACGGGAEGQINRPLAQAEIVRAADSARVREVVGEFARRNNFAVQDLLSRPRGNLDFMIRLYRDDISIIVSRMAGDPTGVAAYPLCVCEVGSRLGLQAAADAAVNELRENLAR